MKLIILVLVSSHCLLHTAFSQTQTMSPMPLAMEFFESLDQQQQQYYYRTFDDNRRITWERLPKVREGLKLADLSETQKYLFHQFLQASLSSEGYLMVTAVMFNEDIQQRFEPYLGRNEFYIELFGMPEAGAHWGWQLEGHHLSLNLTFKGDKLISNTPFLLASNPQIVNSDRERNGLCLLYLEEQIAGQLAESLEGEARVNGYSPQTRPRQVYGEIQKDRLEAPAEGVELKELGGRQQELASELVGAYMRYFKLSMQERQAMMDELTNPKTLFYYMQHTHYNKEHYYRLYNPTSLIECENYGNHSHHFWRMANDFGQAVIPN